MGARPVLLTNTIVVRVSDEMHAALVADAEAKGRTVAQSVRFLLAAALPSKEEK